MTESLDLKTWEPIRAGAHVRLKDDISPRTLQALAPEIHAGTTYLVYAVTMRDDGNHSVWIGPAHDAYRDFDPEISDERFKDVCPLSIHHLRPVGD